MGADHLLDIQAELGEAPVWDTARRRLYMVDIIRCRLICYEWDSAETREWPLPSLGGGLALCTDGRLLVATQTGLFFFDPDSGGYEFFLDPEPNVPFNRLNEGKCDPQGRLWIGSICTLDRRPSGHLYRVGPEGTSQAVLSDIYVPNCLVWQRDGRRVFFADSHRKTIWSFSYRAEDGVVSDRQLFLDLSGNPGIPDGGAIDGDGCLWNAEFGGGVVRRYTPSGAVDREIRLPVSQVTSCCFAGPKLDTLIIVTAKRLLSPDRRKQQPLAGDVFAVQPSVSGFAEPLFGHR